MFNDTTMHETTLKQNDIIETWLHTEQYHRDIDAQNGIIRASLNRTVQQTRHCIKNRITKPILIYVKWQHRIHVYRGHKMQNNNTCSNTVTPRYLRNVITYRVVPQRNDYMQSIVRKKQHCIQYYSQDLYRMALYRHHRIQETTTKWFS